MNRLTAHLIDKMDQAVVPVIDYFEEFSTVDGENGLQPGDRIVAVNGTEIESYDDLKAFLKTVSVGDTLRFVVSRSGQPMEINVIAGEYVPEQIQKQNNSNI